MRSLFTAVALTGILLASCTEASKESPPLHENVSVTEAGKSAAESTNAFAIDLYKQLRGQQGNLFLSPASISTALAMTAAGASGETEREMEQVLHLGADQQTADGFSNLMRLLNSRGAENGYTLRTANRLWGAEEFRFQPAFLTLTRERYSAELEPTNFDAPEQARSEINDWVSEQTAGKITDLIPARVLNPQTKLVLTNAIYFEGGWEEEFNRSATRPAPFHHSADRSADVPMMRQTESFPYTDDEAVQVLSLPYRGGNLSMLIILPKQIDGLAAVEEKLTLEQINGWIAALRPHTEVRLFLPQFTMRSQLSLADPLKALGMATAFTDQADFSGIAQSEDSLFISDAIHQAFVEVDEKGTKAAAATGVVVGVTSAPAPSEPVEFRADHPFLFLIREQNSGAILFLGRLAKPE